MLILHLVSGLAALLLLHILQLLLVALIHSQLFLVELFASLFELVDLSGQEVGLCKLEDVRVEAGHFVLDMVVEEGLSQVASMNAHRNFLEKVLHCQAKLFYLRLR